MSKRSSANLNVFATTTSTLSHGPSPLMQLMQWPRSSSCYYAALRQHITRTTDFVGFIDAQQN